jgi:hypothetical protein
MKQRIVDRFELNIARVKNLVTIYQSTLAGAGPGRRSHQKTDVLRAAVVLLHASVEDALRSLAYWKLPNAAAGVLDQFSLVGNGPAMKFSLGALAEHRGKTVDDVLKASVDSYLERSNYNNTVEVSGFLTQIGLNVAAVNHTYPLLEELMKRRHQIVHRADRDEAGGQGNHKVRSVSPATVNNWIANVEAFIAAVLAQI